MRYNRLIPLAVLALAVACNENSSNPAENAPNGISASSAHLKGGGNAEPTFFDGGFTLTASGAVSGVGGEDVFVSLVATANATAVCENPGGGQQAPGQNPAPVTVSGGQAIPASEIKNGNLTFNVTTNAPSPLAGPATKDQCPNTSWTYRLTSLSFTSATITIHQPAGSIAQPGPVVLTVSCSLTAAGGSGSSDGAIAGSQVTCTQSS